MLTTGKVVFVEPVMCSSDGVQYYLYNVVQAGVPRSCLVSVLG